MPRLHCIRQQRLIALAVAVVQFPIVTAGIVLLAVKPPAKGGLSVVVWLGAVLVLPIAAVPLAEVLLIADRAGPIKTAVDAGMTLKESRGSIRPFHHPRR